MALIWAESFDFYGNNNSLLIGRGYTANNIGSFAGLINDSGQARTGTGFFRFAAIFDNSRNLIRSINGANTVGSGLGIKFFGTPGNSPQSPSLRFGSNSSSRLVSVVAMADLGIGLYSNGVLVGQSDANTINLGTYYWLEVKAENNEQVSGNPLVPSGRVEIRINGIVCLIVNGLNFSEQFTNVSIGQAGEGLSGNGGLDIDDWIIWDGSGDYNNDFLGDRRCFTTYTDADTALADWTPSTGTEGFSILNNAPANDTEYVQANSVGDISEFGMQPIGIASNDVAAVCIIGRAAKVDAGSATFRLGINSAGIVSNSAEFAPNVSPSFSYFNFIAERNPNGDIPWTRLTADAALPRITRES